ncbi:MAG: hypothetical protein J6A28_03075, partial [Clostridia bacterium]|nr:hypothetical protein [Clostridia bacterium]
GFEPTTYRLTAERSTTELLGNIKFYGVSRSAVNLYRFNSASLRTHFVGVQPHAPPLSRWETLSFATIISRLQEYNIKYLFICQ